MSNAPIDRPEGMEDQGFHAQGPTAYNKANPERRFVMLVIAPETIMHVFQIGIAGEVGGGDREKILRVPRSAGIPTDAKVKEIAYLYAYRAFGLIIEHPSFDPVPECREIPLRHLEFYTVHIPAK